MKYFSSLTGSPSGCRRCFYCSNACDCQLRIQCWLLNLLFITILVARLNFSLCSFPIYVHFELTNNNGIHSLTSTKVQRTFFSQDEIEFQLFFEFSCSKFDCELYMFMFICVVLLIGIFFSLKLTTFHSNDAHIVRVEKKSLVLLVIEFFRIIHFTSCWSFTNNRRNERHFRWLWLSFWR